VGSSKQQTEHLSSASRGGNLCEENQKEGCGDEDYMSEQTPVFFLKTKLKKM